VDLATASQSRRIALCGQALSASGIGIQGGHIVHPGGNEASPAGGCDRIWVLAADAALAEVWSTALMLVDPRDLPAVLAQVPELIAVHAEVAGELRSIRPA
jgi:thiamine biosynthesis lipoprotein ApbE